MRSHDLVAGLPGGAVQLRESHAVEALGVRLALEPGGVTVLCHCKVAAFLVRELDAAHQKVCSYHEQYTRG